MNIAEIRAKLAGLSNKSKKRNDLWRPTNNHTVRCLQYPHGDKDFILELGFHYDIGSTKSILCPKHNFGEDCPVCDLAAKLRSWNDEDGNEKPKSLRESDFELFKKVQVKERWYVPVIDREKPEDGPKFWAFGKTIYERILNLCLNEELAEIAGQEGTEIFTNVDSAFDLTVDFKEPGNKDGKGNMKSFPVTDVGHKMRPSKLAKTKKEVQELLDKIPVITDIYERVTTDQVQKALDEFLNSGGAEANVEDSGVEYSANTAEKPVEGGQSIDEAFNNL